MWFIFTYLPSWPTVLTALYALSLHFLFPARSVNELLHHNFELREVDLPISVQVNLFDNLVPDCLVLAHVVAENLGNFSSFNWASVIAVEKLEGRLKVVLIQKRALVDRRRTPLTKVDWAVTVSIGCVKEFRSLYLDLVGINSGVDLLVSGNEFVFFNFTVAIWIELVERCSELFLFFFCWQLCRHKSDGSLLKLGLSSKLF